jgi:hypothetical protein
VYLLDNGEVLMLWLGSHVPRSFLQQVCVCVCVCVCVLCVYIYIYI